jgi:DNA-binding transcriptional LysR family regulator
LSTKARRAVDTPEFSIRQLRGVVAVAYYNSFIAAAADLRISQSGVSRIVQQVEADLGFVLFERGTRRVATTSRGREFIGMAERIVRDFDKSMRELRQHSDEDAGHVVISSLMSATHDILPRVVEQFRSEFAGVTLDIREGVQGDVMDDVRTGVADIGIGYTLEPQSHEARELLGEELWQEDLVVVLPQGHRFASSSTLRIADVASQIVIFPPLGSQLRRVLDGLAAASNFDFPAAVTVSHLSTMLNLVAAGVGSAVVSSSMARAAEQRGLVARPLANAGSPRNVGILRLRGREPTPATEAFVKVLKQWAKTHLPDELIENTRPPKRSRRS